MVMKVATNSEQNNSNVYSNNEVDGYEQTITEIEVTEKINNENNKIEDKDSKDKEINEKDLRKQLKN